MKRALLISMLLCFPLGTRAVHDIDWDDWTRGDVRVQLRVRGGEGELHALGAPVGLRLSANEDAYHLVYAIDTDGYVRLLFPRPWEDDGWLEARETLVLDTRLLAWPTERWGRGGIVYVEAVASPVPFDFAALGVGMHAGCSSWSVGGWPYRIAGDPFLAFNDVHRVLFPHWDEAVFAVDYTYFYVGAYRDAPRYLGYAYQRVYVPPPPRFSVGVRFGWSWDYGPRYCRPVYARYYVPGRHVVHHHVHHHWIVADDSAPVQWREPTAPARRVVHEPPVLRQRERDEPARQRAPAATRQRQAIPVAEGPRRATARARDTAPHQEAATEVKQRTAPVPAAVARRFETSRGRKDGEAMKVAAGAKAERRAATVERSKKERRR